MATPQSEIWHILRAQTGDREAFDALLKSVQEPLYRYLSRLVGDAAQAEDVLQEVFLLIYRKLIWLQDPQLFRPWAYRIATRAAFRYLRRERRWSEQIRDEEVLAGLPQPLTEERLAPELQERLPYLVASLSPASRAVLVLHYLHEMPLSEVAAVLEIAPGTAKSRLSYGLARLRKLLQEKNYY